MCGIVGLLSHSANLIERTVLEDMRDAMAHRGPDGADTWMSADRKIGLGHRRLSIVDLHVAATQPMRNEDGTVIITFNGEIYNHARIRPELVELGHRFRTDHSDTEVLVHGYEEWGEELPGRLNGMFAFAIYDRVRKRLFLARDRFGEKPLFYATGRNFFGFASELQALACHPAVDRK